MEKLYKHKKTYHNFLVLSDKMKKDLGIEKADQYNSSKMKLTITHEGNKGIKKFTYLSCRVCHKDKLPELLKKYSDKLPDRPNITHLIENWDILEIPADLLDIAGCMIPDESHIHAAPNGRRFILRPTEHATSCHLKPTSSKASPCVTNVPTNNLVWRDKCSWESQN